MDIGGQTYRVHETLSSANSDRSVALRATNVATEDDMVIRAFDRESKAVAHALYHSQALKGEDSIAPYVAHGAFVIEHPQMKSYKKPPMLYGVVRAYEPYTLGGYAQEHRVSSDSAMTWIRHLVRALRELHSQGIVHGALNPENILLTDGLEVRVADFGLELDEYGVQGDARFQSPEVDRGTQSDVYSFGKLTRFLIQRAEDVEAVTRNRLDWTISRCLALDPSERPEIDDVLDMLFGEDDRGVEFDHDEVVSAAVTDMDARRQLGDRDLGSVRSVALACGRALQLGAATPLGYRLRDLSQPQRAHLVASLTMCQLPDNLIFTVPGNTILKKEFHKNAMDGAPHNRLMDAPLDPLWQAAIEQQPLALTSEEEAQLEELAAHLKPAELEAIARSTSGQFRDEQIRLALEVRNNLLGRDTFVTSEQVVGVMSLQSPGVTTDEVRILRDLGYLLSAQVGERRYYPLFQFDDSGLPYRSVFQVNQAFADPRMSSWGVVSWWLSGHRLLSGRTPAEVLQDLNGDERILQMLALESAA